MLASTSYTFFSTVSSTVKNRLLKSESVKAKSTNLLIHFWWKDQIFEKEEIILFCLSVLKLRKEIGGGVLGEIRLSNTFKHMPLLTLLLLWSKWEIIKMIYYFLYVPLPFFRSLGRGNRIKLHHAFFFCTWVSIEPNTTVSWLPFCFKTWRVVLHIF